MTCVNGPVILGSKTTPMVLKGIIKTHN